MQKLTLVALLTAFSFAACTPLPRNGEPVLSPEEIRFRAIEGKLEEMSRRVNAAENKDDSATQNELRRLQGQAEQLRYDSDSALRRQKDLTSDLERRIAKLEGNHAQAQSAAAAAAAAAAAVINPPAPPLMGLPPSIATPANPVTLPNPGNIVQSATSAAEEEAAYLRAFDYLKAGKYDNAIVSFRAVIDRWPRGGYADNSWYWLGESQYVKRQYQPSFSAFSTLVDQFPASPKVPDALFKSGLAQNELGNVEAAKALWKRVVKDYPNANAANLARQRLAQAR